MCLRVRFASTISHPYNAERGVITLPAGLTRALTLRAARAAVAELRIPQDGDTPLCWCGQPLDLSGRIPAQRTGEAVSSGA